MPSAPGLRQSTALGRDTRRLRLAARVSSPCRPPRGGLHESLAFWSFRALRRSNRCSDRSRIPLAFHPHSAPGLPSQLRGALGVSHSLDAFFRNLSSGLVSCRCRPWAFTLRRFLPARSPVSLSARGVLRAVLPLARASTSRMSASVGCVSSVHGVSTCDARSSLGRCPLRGIYLPVSLRASASLLSWASLGALRSLGLAASRSSGLSSCSSEFQRT